MCVAPEHVATTGPCIQCGSFTSAQQALILAAQARYCESGSGSGTGDVFDEEDFMLAGDAPLPEERPAAIALSSAHAAGAEAFAAEDSWLLPQGENDWDSEAVAGGEVSSIPPFEDEFPRYSEDLDSGGQDWLEDADEDDEDGEDGEDEASVFGDRERWVDGESSPFSLEAGGRAGAPLQRAAEPSLDERRLPQMPVQSVPAPQPEVAPPFAHPAAVQQHPSGAVPLFEKNFIGRTPEVSHLPPPRENSQVPRREEVAAPFVPHRVIAAAEVAGEDDWKTEHRRRSRIGRRRRDVERKLERIADSPVWGPLRGLLAVVAVATIGGSLWWMKANNWGNDLHMKRVKESRRALEVPAAAVPDAVVLDAVVPDAVVLDAVVPDAAGAIEAINLPDGEDIGHPADPSGHFSEQDYGEIDLSEDFDPDL